MSGYETEELGRIESALDDLVSPTSEDVWQATRPFDERAIASVAATRAGSGGGGSSPFLTATVTLTDADIKALPTTRFEVIPATEILNYSTPPATLPMLVQASAWIVKPNSVGYTNTTSETILDLCYGSDYSTKAGRMMEILANGFSTDTQIFNNYLAGAINDNQPSWPMGFEFGSQFLGGANYQDNGVYAAIQPFAAGDLTGGDPANKLLIDVVYRIVTAPV